jgi:hypothetical protein
MILNKIILIIASLFVAINAQCPTWWWPMSAVSPSIGFFSEVMRGNTIQGAPGATTAISTLFSVFDRLAAGRQHKSITLGATQLLQLPADTYFCNGAFTISLFLNHGTPAAAALADFVDLAGTNIVRYAIGADALANTLTVGVTTSSATVTAHTAAWTFFAVSYGGSATTPNFFKSSVASNTVPTAIPGTLIATAPTCTTMIAAIIGATTAAAPGTFLGAVSSINDFKIYNFGLTTAQVQARYTAEISNLLK